MCGLGWRKDGKLRKPAPGQGQGTVLLGKKMDIPVGPFGWSDMYANCGSVNSAVDVKVGKAVKAKLLKKRMNIDISYGYPVKPNGVRGHSALMDLVLPCSHAPSNFFNREALVVEHIQNGPAYVFVKHLFEGGRAHDRDESLELWQ